MIGAGGGDGGEVLVGIDVAVGDPEALEGAPEAGTGAAEQDGAGVKQDAGSGGEHGVGEQAQTRGSARTITLTLKCGLFLMSILKVWSNARVT